MRINNETDEQHIYTYDEEGFIVEEQTLPREIMKKLDPPSYKMGSGIEHDIWIPAGSKSIYRYTYDDQKRIQNVLFTINGRRFLEDTYTYRGNTIIPEKIERYIKSFAKKFYFTKNVVEYYDKHNNIIQQINLDDKGTPVHYNHYEYTYDTQNNWTRCDMYCEGEKEKTAQPTVTIYRDITYYKEEKRK